MWKLLGIPPEEQKTEVHHLDELVTCSFPPDDPCAVAAGDELNSKPNHLFPDMEQAAFHPGDDSWEVRKFSKALMSTSCPDLCRCHTRERERERIISVPISQDVYVTIYTHI